MLVDSYIVPECIAGPRSFGGLMALYEGNYIKLTQLAPEVTRCAGTHVSHSDDDFPLHLHLESRTPYTALIRITYIFDEDAVALRDPDMQLRVYFDARMVEVLSWSRHDRHQVLRDLALRYPKELDRRWVMNQVLGKWLDYLLDMGHRFPSLTPVPVPLGSR